MKKKLYFLLITMLLVTLTAEADDYNLWVAGVRVTSSNCNDIKSPAIERGTASYDPYKNELTLTNFKAVSSTSIIKTDGTPEPNHPYYYLTFHIRYEGDCYLKSTGSITMDFNEPGRNTTCLQSFDDCRLTIISNTTDAIVCRGRGLEIFNYNSNNSIEIISAARGVVYLNYDSDASFPELRLSGNISITAGNRAIYAGNNPLEIVGGHIRLKSTSVYPVVDAVKELIYYSNAILAPIGAYFDPAQKTIVYENGYPVTNDEILISDDGALLINKENFPDDNFRRIMLNLYPKGYLTQTELEARKELSVDNKSIYDLTGVEKLTYLEDLSCERNNLTTLNLRDLANLRWFSCNDNDLTSIDVTNDNKLRTLNCNRNSRLSTITGLTSNELMYFSGADCAFTNLRSVLNRPKLTELFCGGNKFTELEINNMQYLINIDCSDSPLLKSIIVKNNPELMWFHAENSPQLYRLEVQYNPSLISIEADGCTSLQMVHCQGNNLSKLEINGCSSSLVTIFCHKNRLTSLDLSNMPKLSYVYCYDNKLQSLKVNGCPNLQYLSCEKNQLTSLNVQGCSSLLSLDCYENQIKDQGMSTLVTSLPLRSATEMGSFYVFNADADDGNMITVSQLLTAFNKYWNFYAQVDGEWVNFLEGLVPCDVNFDHELNIADVNALVDIIKSGETGGQGDVNGDGEINIADINRLIDIILGN